MSDITPPNWPIHNVNLSDEQILGIIGKVYTGSRPSQITKLGKKKSFNNRIYFVSIDHQGTEDRPDEAVIKVNGRFFGPSKVQNEVSCLLLLHRFCPEVPAPRVLAWSEDGSKICSIRNGVFAVLYDEVLNPDSVSEQTASQGWIMTTKLPGRILQYSDLAQAHDELVAELADIVAAWRCKIPQRVEIGNLVFQPSDYTSSNSLYGLEIMVGQLILSETQPSSPMGSYAAYYTHLLSDQIHKVETNNVFAFTRSRLLAKLRSFRESVLPDILYQEDSQQDYESVFTQQDFAPRNILVEESGDGKLHVSGIVDFEFAGFFTHIEEFLTCRVRQSDDWPEDTFQLLCAELILRGISVPGYDTELQYFDALRDLAALTENVAPWWLQDGHIKGEALEKELTKTSKIVEDIISKYAEK